MRKQVSPGTRTFLLVTVVFLLSFGVYFNTLFNGFVMDDHFQVVENSWIKDVRNVPEIFSSKFAIGGRSSFYRPLVPVVYMTSYYLFGLAPWGFHLVRVLFHSGVSVVVFLTISFLLRKPQLPAVSPPLSAGEENGGSQWASFAAGLLFATHPVHTEAVAWISVTDLFLAFFSLLSFYFFIRSADDDALLRGSHVLSVVSFFLAILCKEPALTLPAIFICYDYVFKKEGQGIAYYAKRYVPFLVAAGVYGALRLHAFGGSVEPFKASPGLSPSQYALSTLTLFGKYIEKLLLPVNLNVWHVFQPPDTLFSFTGIVSLLVTAGFLFSAFAAIRRYKVAFLGFLFIMVPLMPAFYLPGLTQGLENAFTERYLYLPSFGFVLLIALFIARVREKRPEWTAALAIVCFVMTILYSIGTVSRNAAWKDSYTLWSDAAMKSPRSGEPHNALGDYFKEKGMLDEAIAHYQVGVSLSPRISHIHANLGVAYAQKGMTDKSIEEIKVALLLEPGYPEAHDSLGVVYARMGRYAEAIKEFQAAADLDPSFENAYKHLGIAYSDVGQTDQAIEYLRKALTMNPYDADAHNNLGIAYVKKGLMDEAMKHFEAAVRLKPADPDFHLNLARIYKIKGLSGKAEEHFRAAESLEKK